MWINNNIQINSKNNFIFSKKKIIFQNIENLSVVEGSEYVFINKLSNMEFINQKNLRKKELNKDFNKNKFFDFRPWGFYETLTENKFVKLKIINIYPNQQISYQSHNHRVEHWVIVSGDGLFILNESKKFVTKGDYLFIPTNGKHRLKNTSLNQRLVLFEVQMGEKVLENDIIRYSDEYNRI